MRVAIHQPNFFPWIGYFFKMSVCDTFVYLDTVEYSSSSLTRRTYIPHQTNDKGYLIVPLVKHSNHSKINELFIKSSNAWIDRSIAHLRNIYKSTDHYKTNCEWVFSLIERSKDHDKFAAYSMSCNDTIKSYFNINTPTIKASDIPVKGKKSEYITKIVKYLNGTVYCSGTGAQKYQSEEEFKAIHSKLRYVQSFDFLKKNQQKYRLTYPNFSFIDTLFRTGKLNLCELIKDFNQNFINETI